MRRLLHKVDLVDDNIYENPKLCSAYLEQWEYEYTKVIGGLGEISADEDSLSYIEEYKAKAEEYQILDDTNAT